MGRDPAEQVHPRAGAYNFREAADNAAARVVEREADIARTQAEIAANLVDARPRT